MRRYAAIGLLLVGCAAALVYQTRRLGLTVDETSHFAAAYAYWQGQDVLEPPDAPPLTRAICGWVPRLLKAPQLRDTNGWKERDAYLIGAEILDRPNIRARRLLFYTRLPFLLFPLLIVFLLWHWGRQLFGEPVGLFLAVCGALEPTIMGHGVLINSDVPAAFGALWWAYTAWKYWRTPNVRRLLLLTLATVVAALIKFTLLPLAIVTFGLALWKGPRLLAAIVIPLALYIGILAASQFQAQPGSTSRNPALPRRGRSRLGSTRREAARPPALAAAIRARSALHRRQSAGRGIHGLHAGPQDPRLGAALFPARLGNQVPHPAATAHRWPDWRPS